jgi:hypothetical protein
VVLEKLKVVGSREVWLLWQYSATQNLRTQKLNLKDVKQSNVIPQTATDVA